jgi:hypothetical protein
MKSLFLLLTMLAAALQLQAQPAPSAYDLFPAEGSIAQLQRMYSENSFSDPDRLAEVENGKLFSDVGFRDYAERVYGVGNSGRLKAVIVTLIDYRAAFSLLSLLRSAAIEDTGLGDAHVTAPGEVLFCQGRKFVRVRSTDAGGELLAIVAQAISNRIGIPEGKRPSLLSYLPEAGIQGASLQYFPAIKAYEDFLGVPRAESVSQRFEMEIARADYKEGTSSGVLYLMKFPTAEMAEEYFEFMSSPVSNAVEKRIYFNRSGPLLSILEGSFASRSAGNILERIQYGYSIQWIKDTNHQPTVVWGIPVQILNTTVLSFFFVLLLCIACIILGSILAGLRILLRVWLPGNPLDDPKRTEITRLKLP